MSSSDLRRTVRRASATDARARRSSWRELLRPQGTGPTRYWRVGAVITLLMVASTLGWYLTARDTALPPTVRYSDVAGAIATGSVTSLEVGESGRRLTVTLSPGAVLANARGATRVITLVPTSVALADFERWSSAGIAVSVRPADTMSSPQTWNVLVPILIVLVAAGTLVGWQRRMRGGTFVVAPPARHLTMSDVGGAREARADLADVVAFLRSPEKFEAMGARCPKGVLLVGPPGTGKTLLARAVAGEAGVPVIIAGGSDFTEMYVGVGASRVRALARRARESAPCIIFIDEFEALGGRRGRPNRSGEEENTLNALLVEMDGMAGNEGVVWMAATNRDDMLDPAVRRPGRFDRVVEVPLPTLADRLEILRIHAARAPLSPNVDLDVIARLTPGYSGAELANLLNEAALVAVHAGASMITGADIEQARDKILLGRIRAGVVITPSERHVIALHEAGHAVVGMIACPEDRLHKVTIQARGRSLGAAHFSPEADKHLYSRRYLEGVIAKALGGRAAELIFLGVNGVTSGAASDLIQATSVARRMVGEMGMSDRVGLVSADPAAHGGGAPSAQLQSRIDDAVADLVKAQADRAEALVGAHRGAVEAIAAALLEHEVLDAEDVIAIARRHGALGARELVAA
ncbi:ATP-dependent metallopeptidase FtsH/Yme1/Tma family protein [Gemmatimonas groenlandica]|uniref:ATP-dependent zinc metalloprotease FtsH n=1 Tax=Gemmatimonas groenlandica TaxID=2732249 RepID=A0A6M4IHU4_9BACT|nr:AAA family ATPase [Gemmatimonas groenlandica]QJR34674.1 ATP-dependent zinc metalloprotease FtsH [Gemmatimonas groenlandica]